MSKHSRITRPPVVVAGAFQPPRERSFAAAFENSAGQWRLCHHSESRESCAQVASRDSASEGQKTLGRKRIGTRKAFLQLVIGPVERRAGIVPVKLWGRFFGQRRTACQIQFEHLPVVAMRAHPVSLLLRVICHRYSTRVLYREQAASVWV